MPNRKVVSFSIAAAILAININAQAQGGMRISSTLSKAVEPKSAGHEPEPTVHEPLPQPPIVIHDGHGSIEPTSGHSTQSPTAVTHDPRGKAADTGSKEPQIGTKTDAVSHHDASTSPAGRQAALDRERPMPGGKTAYKIKPNSPSIEPLRDTKEILPAKQLSVRDQAIDQATQAIAAMRGIPKYQVAITSLHRSKSTAHARGAFDISTRGSKDPDAEAAAVAKALGPGFVVIHEKPSPDMKIQTNTSFFNRGHLPPQTKPHGTPGYEATAEHLHVQPNDVLKQPDATEAASKK